MMRNGGNGRVHSGLFCAETGAASATSPASSSTLMVGRCMAALFYALGQPLKGCATTMAERRVAVVTGANRGLGLETARQLLARGYRVALTGRDLAAVERARRGLGDAAVDAIAVALDITQPASIAAAARAIDKQWGPVDVLVNNAAILVAENGDALSIPARDYQRSFETNLFGAIE